VKEASFAGQTQDFLEARFWDALGWPLKQRPRRVDESVEKVVWP
jgi:hypothetical protein